jgi:hypothetical protein
MEPNRFGGVVVVVAGLSVAALLIPAAEWQVDRHRRSPLVAVGVR